MLKHLPSHIRIVSTDIFDTLLLRNYKSQTARVAEGEMRFSRLLSERGFTIDSHHLVKARSIAQAMAYKALNVHKLHGEVKLADIVANQLALLGLPDRLLADRIALELAIEKRSLLANGDLARFLRQLRQAGQRIVAVSDTGLSAEAIGELINHFHGPGLIDRIYSSADEQQTKRHGGLFHLLMEQEGVAPHHILHLGDDRLADKDVPASMGIRTMHMPRASIARTLTRVNGAYSLSKHYMTGKNPLESSNIPQLSERFDYGHRVFGPIVAEFCLKIWLYVQQASLQGPATLLFCARGGAGIREAFERVTQKLGLPVVVPRATLLVSRLIAARAAIARRTPAALDEIQREFHGRSFREVANALGGVDYDLPESWDRVFTAGDFYAMLDHPLASKLCNDIQEQTDLFERHLETVSGGATRLILCDTGLYGSTQRLLSAGFPAKNFETIQFARCNYKGLPEDHFGKVAGLVVECNAYDPFHRETVILRYWHIIESLFEPAIPSVRQFKALPDGTVEANCGYIAYPLPQDRLNPLLLGALHYIETLQSGIDILDDAATAWRRLKQAITNPDKSDLQILDVEKRSVDFGRLDYVDAMTTSTDRNVLARLRAIQSNLWREGAIARDFSTFGPVLLTALEMAHVVRRFSGHRKT
ncbi:hydrolase [Allorhizobium sp. BGMRC 0089]|uniref:hydrolase n=1 Tax=Allorhizobium sonneratiae TaxID=2934936 RepID=UPI00203343AC|nr:hydrolase [Allorhizobium sonneratiae]MCM2293296.1 hydrolase [Allorhizobium sonneratiae]